MHSFTTLCQVGNNDGANNVVHTNFIWEMNECMWRQENNEAINSLINSLN